MDGEFRTKGAIMSQFQKNVLFIGAEVIVVMRKLSIISVLLPLIWVLINPGAVWQAMLQMPRLEIASMITSRPGDISSST